MSQQIHCLLYTIQDFCLKETEYNALDIHGETLSWKRTRSQMPPPAIPLEILVMQTLTRKPKYL